MKEQQDRAVAYALPICSGRRDSRTRLAMTE